MDLSALKDHLIQAVAAAALLGGGAALVDAKVDNARQDEQLKAASEILPEIQKDVRETVPSPSMTRVWVMSSVVVPM